MGGGFREAERAGATECGGQLDTEVERLYGGHVRRPRGGFTNHE